MQRFPLPWQDERRHQAGSSSTLILFVKEAIHFLYKREKEDRKRRLVRKSLRKRPAKCLFLKLLFPFERKRMLMKDVLIRLHQETIGPSTVVPASAVGPILCLLMRINFPSFIKFPSQPFPFSSLKRRPEGQYASSIKKKMGVVKEMLMASSVGPC